MHRVKAIKEILIGWVECEVGKGQQYFDVEACGEVVDMINDLAETEEKCAKAEYYASIVDDMKQWDESSVKGERRYGYDNWRYASGQFAPTGHGHRSGYTPMTSANVQVHDPSMSGRFRMGYPMEPSKYDMYQDAKRHYSESGKPEDRDRMNEAICGNVTNIMEQLEEMAEDASPESRRKLKAEATELIDKLNRMM